MKFYDRLSTMLEEKKNNGTLKNERVICSPQGTEIKVSGIDCPVINFCSNDYLGLSNHPAVIKAARQALDVYGYGLSSVRFICGTQSVHKELEERLADFLGMEDAILYSSCFAANGGLFEGILTEEDAIVSARLNHASIIDGVRLCKAQRLIYNGEDAADLDNTLSTSSISGTTVVMTDGVFSMEGSLALLDRLLPVCQRHGALLAVDDSHATGLVGKGGKGTPEHCGVGVDILTGTLGKALGGASGGYIAGKRVLIDTLRNVSRPYLFSNSLPPNLVAGAIAAIDIVHSDEGMELRAKLNANLKYFRMLMRDMGFDVSADGNHAIVPIFLPDAATASKMAERLLELGIYVVSFSFPVVPKDSPRIRVQLSARHTSGQIECAVSAFYTAGKELGIISNGSLNRTVTGAQPGTQTMKAWVYKNQAQADGGHLSLEDIPVPVPNPGDLLLKILKVTVCGTDEDLFRGKFHEIEDGIVSGHEIFGQIVGWGSNVRGFEIGQKVVAESHYLLPGYIEEGVIGLWGPKIVKGGYLRPINGGYAEYMTLPSYCAHIVPHVLDSDDFFPSLLEGAGNDCLIAKYLLDHGFLGTVGVVGCGPHGLFTQLFCKHFGVENLAAFEVDPARMEFARDFGADRIINSASDDLSQQIDDFTSGKGFDVLIDTAGGRQSVLDMCLDNVKDGGTVVLFGLYGDESIKLEGYRINDIIFRQLDLDMDWKGKKVHVRGITGREGIWEYLIDTVALSKDLQRKLMKPVTIMGPLNNLGPDTRTLDPQKIMKRAYTAFAPES